MEQLPALILQLYITSSQDSLCYNSLASRAKEADMSSEFTILLEFIFLHHYIGTLSKIIECLFLASLDLISWSMDFEGDILYPFSTN